MYLGLDLGTSGLKGVVINQAGELIAISSKSLEVSSPKPLWSEQDPLSWWQAVKEVVASLHMILDSQGQDFSQLKGIGLSGQMHGATFLDKQGEVLRPCILWNDGRSQQECQDLITLCPNLLKLSSNLAMSGFTSPKALWLKRHEPALFAKVQYVLLPKDYLSYRLTGKLATDCSDAAGTLWLNPATRQWDTSLLAATDFTLDNMPKVHEACDVIGCLSDDVAALLSLPQVPVVAGAGDNAAGAVGMGVVNTGQGLISLGTSGVYFSVSDQHRANPEKTVHAFCHALPNRWHQMGVTLSAANSLSWVAKLANKPVADLLNALESFIEKRGHLRTKLVFLPYLNGERTPHNNPLMTGQFIGLVNDTSIEEMTLAVLEGVAFSLLDCQKALANDDGVKQELSLIGGGARSPLWRQILSNVLNQTLVYRDGGEVAPGLGAARLAMIGVRYEDALYDVLDAKAPNHVLENLIAEICVMPEVLDEHTPQAELAEYYLKKYEIYCQLAKASFVFNQSLSELG